MSEFEYYQAVKIASSAIPGASMNFVYLVFAYIVASYLAGKELPRLIAVGASIVFTLSLIGPLAAVVIGVGQSTDLTLEYQLVFPEGTLFRVNVNSVFAYVVTITPLFVGWLASVLFLHCYIRRNSTEVVNSDT